jgi:Mitochondrial carrier protein
MQMQSSLPLAERQTLSQIVSSLGIRGMYQGTLATLSRDVPYSFIFFPLYANVKAAMADSKGNNSMASVMLSGMLSGAIAAGAVTPTDVVKTR